MFSTLPVDGHHTAVPPSTDGVPLDAQLDGQLDGSDVQLDGEFDF